MKSKLQNPLPGSSTSDPSSSRSNRGSYMKISDAQRFAIAKQAALFGTAAAMRYFASKYPDQFVSFK